MSAENETTIYRMSNGEYWVVVRRCGDTILECYGEVTAIIAKLDSYAKAKALLLKTVDRSSENYVYTEHGCHLPEKKNLLKKPARFVKSRIVIRCGRTCRRGLRFQDLARKNWEVVEYNSEFGVSRGRVILRGVIFSQAVTFARLYATAQPGECIISDFLFYVRSNTKHSKRHRYDHGESLDLPDNCSPWDF